MSEVTDLTKYAAKLTAAIEGLEMAEKQLNGIFLCNPGTHKVQDFEESADFIKFTKERMEGQLAQVWTRLASKDETQ